MTQDEQEALSKKYGTEVVMLLPLKSGKIAIFNSARELCGIIDGERINTWNTTWHPPTSREPEGVVVVHSQERIRPKTSSFMSDEE